MDNITRRFELTLIGHYWDLVPEYSIHCNGIAICNKKKLPTKNNEAYIEKFEVDYNGPYILDIYFRNKTTDQSVLNLNRNRLVRDMLLEVSYLTVDNIYVPINDNCVYYLSQSQMYQGSLVKNISGTSVMGFNGRLSINIP